MVGAREYDPEIGRFLQPDPRPTGPELQWGQLNRWAYCANDPVNASDPSGEIAGVAGIGLAVPGFGWFLAALVAVAATAFLLYELLEGGAYASKYDPNAKISELIGKYVPGSVLRCGLPPGGPGWNDILRMTWGAVIVAARQGERWAMTVKKIFEKGFHQ